MTDEEWDDVIGTNLSGTFYVMRAFLPIFLSNRKGRFISLSSIAKDGLSGQANYAASKAGLIGLSRTIAKEYGQKGITSNVVAPGMFETDMVKENLSDSGQKIKGIIISESSDAQLEYAIQVVPNVTFKKMWLEVKIVEW